ncbi:MAG: hypothetical protein Sylvanvirus16_3 [Sylvanvirus sp.]|uniref:Uncharacterized protein n=1 Tax=Sylvanvirus sp. TaxID=2487774 RepID=A0A3G5AIC0_9VIRU|nr:MAG: hypothetical protein Sylvanvirus16_3 [Sylvanvirus sp.]
MSFLEADSYYKISFHQLKNTILDRIDSRNAKEFLKCVPLLHNLVLESRHSLEKKHDLDMIRAIGMMDDHHLAANTLSIQQHLHVICMCQTLKEYVVRDTLIDASALIHPCYCHFRVLGLSKEQHIQYIQLQLSHINDKKF